jgi:glycosyltransferase involved in cell wall biosynthesis
MKKGTLFLSGKTEVVYQGVDTSLFRPSHNGEANVLRKELGLDAVAPLVGMVGRFDPQKGHKIFLEAAALVLERRPGVRFVVVGGVLFADVFPFYNDYHSEVMQCHHRLGLEGKVLFLSHRTDMPEVMRGLDLLVLPSTREGFGLVVLEALSSGVPVVASDSAGAAEVIRDIPSVGIATCGDPESFAREILKALDAGRGVPGRAAFSEGAAGKKLPGLEGLDWDTSARKMEKVYTAVGCPEPELRSL